MLEKLANAEHKINVDLIGHKFKFDVADVDIEAIQRLTDFALSAQTKPFDMALYNECKNVYIDVIGEEHYNKAMNGKPKSIKNLAKLTIAVGKILEEVNKYYAKPDKGTTK